MSTVSCSTKISAGTETRWLESMRPFLERDPGGALRICGRSAVELAEACGTPLAVYDLDKMRHNANLLKEAWASDALKLHPCYAIKANYLPPLLAAAAGEDFNFEIMSPFELEVVRSAAPRPDSLVVNGLGWSAGEIKEVLEYAPAYWCIDSSADGLRLAQTAAQAGRIQPVLIRFQPGFSGSSGAFVRAGDKLGSDLASGRKILSRLLACGGIHIAGLSLHAYSREIDPTRHLAAIEEALQARALLEAEFPVRLDVLDIGGGMAAPSILKTFKMEVDRFIKPIKEKLEHAGVSRVIIEPGRYLAADAGFVVTKVITAKEAAGRKWLIVDAGTNYLIPLPAANFIALAAQSSGSAPQEEVSVGDRICSPAGYIADSLHLGAVREDEILVIGNCGAYTENLRESFGVQVPGVAFFDGPWRSYVQTAQQARTDPQRLEPLRLEQSEGTPALIPQLTDYCIDAHAHLGRDKLNEALNGAEFRSTFGGKFGPALADPGELQKHLSSHPQVLRVLVMPQPWTDYLDLGEYLKRGYWRHWALRPHDLETSRPPISGKMRFPYEAENSELFSVESSRLWLGPCVAPDRYIEAQSLVAYRDYLAQLARRAAAFKYHPRGLAGTIREMQGGAAVEIASAAGIPLLIHCTANDAFSPQQACRLARDNPSLKVIICHLAAFSSHCWRDIDRLPNLFADASAVELCAERQRYFSPDAMPLRRRKTGELMRHLAASGKLVWGSDFPWISCIAGRDYAGQVEDYFALPPQTRQNVMKATLEAFERSRADIFPLK